MNIIDYFFNASLIVKCVMLMLVGGSVFSWMLIFQRGFYLQWLLQHTQQFERLFWTSKNLTHLYQECMGHADKEGVEKLFIAGFKEFLQVRDLAPEKIISSVERSMRIALNNLTEEIEESLGFLATIASVSPYVGLFGTVWGIMTAFQSLSHVQQATISMVAPGISEALIATAMGLFTAIPAVIAYNRYRDLADRLSSRCESFCEMFSNYLYRQSAS